MRFTANVTDVKIKTWEGRGREAATKAALVFLQLPEQDIKIYYLAFKILGRSILAV